jgi:beta-barrel assembly-enhancing protease
MNNNFSRRRFIQTMGAGTAILGVKNAMGFDFGSALEQASPYLQHAQPLAESFMLSEKDEIQMGNTYYDQYIEQGGGRYSDTKMQEALKKFAQPLIATSDRKALAWDIVLLKSDEVNAWALPGGKMAVNSGLLNYVKDPDELASVIAHEIGHVEKSHGIDQMKTDTFMKSIGGLGKQVLASYGGSAGAMSSELLSSLEGPVYEMINSGYSQKREFEADAHILSVFNKVGLDAKKADDFFVTLNKLYPSDTDITTSLFSTHPGTVERIKTLEQLATKQSQVPEKKSSYPGWNALKEQFPTKSIG